MGVIYKLKPEIKSFILGKKKEEGALSCRKFSKLIHEKFQIKVSKSSINAIFKEAGLSMPVGRRQKKRRQPAYVEVENAGAMFLKAADALLGGTNLMSSLMNKKLGIPLLEASVNIEGVLYRLFKPEDWLTYLTGSTTNTAKDMHLIESQDVRNMVTDFRYLLSKNSNAVRGIKIVLSNGESIYLDGQFRTIWAVPHIPADFSTTLYNSTSYINRHFTENMPLVLSGAAGTDGPSAEFMDFLEAMEGHSKQVAQVSFYGNTLEEHERIQARQEARRFFVFALWPNQFSSYKKIKAMAEFQPYACPWIREELRLASVEVELSQQFAVQRVMLRGCAIKSAQKEQLRLLVLSNLPAEKASPEEIANLYLRHWPNMEEGRNDFQRKIEFFAYAGAGQEALLTQHFVPQKVTGSEISELLTEYLASLHKFVACYFLPGGSTQLDFSTVSERFYNLKGRLTQQKDTLLVTLFVPDHYSYQRDLAYACRRANEHEAMLVEARKLHFETVF